MTVQCGGTWRKPITWEAVAIGVHVPWLPGVQSETLSGKETDRQSSDRACVHVYCMIHICICVYIYVYMMNQCMCLREDIYIEKEGPIDLGQRLIKCPLRMPGIQSHRHEGQVPAR